MLWPKASKGSLGGVLMALAAPLVGCSATAAGLLAAETPPGQRLNPRFAIEVQTAAAEPRQETWQEPAVAARDFSPVRLMGRAQVPLELAGVANLQDGYVSGSPVAVFDATTGRQVARAVTFYDGSFAADIPLRSGQVALVVTAELVSKHEPGKAVRLMAPALVTAGTVEQSVVLSPGTTALVAFLGALAQEQKGRSLDEIELLRLDGSGPGHVSDEFGSLIAMFQPDVQASFARLAEASPELRKAGSLEGLASGIQRYVGRLTRSQVKVGGSKP